jgi:hypothetical protein
MNVPFHSASAPRAHPCDKKNHMPRTVKLSVLRCSLSACLWIGRGQKPSKQPFNNTAPGLKRPCLSLPSPTITLHKIQVAKVSSAEFSQTSI